MVLINILTRTSNRPIFFADCVSSIRNQTHRPIRHIVGADDAASLVYARALVPDAMPVAAPPNNLLPRPNEAPYNLYMNALTQNVEDGWIMYLDDDDTFVDADSLAAIAAHATDEDRVLLWRVGFPGTVVPSDCFGKVPVLGDVTAAGLMFHCKHRRYAQWDAVRGADHRVIERLFLLLKPHWIDRVLTRANYDPTTSNFCGGRGKRHDKTGNDSASVAVQPQAIWPMSELRSLRERVRALEAQLHAR